MDSISARFTYDGGHFSNRYYWLKTPGESDGCTELLPDGTPCPRFDRSCASIDSIGSAAGEPRAPEAGEWFVPQLAELACRAELKGQEGQEGQKGCDGTIAVAAEELPRPKVPIPAGAGLYDGPLPASAASGSRWNPDPKTTTYTRGTVSPGRGSYQWSWLVMLAGVLVVLLMVLLLVGAEEAREMLAAGERADAMDIARAFGRKVLQVLSWAATTAVLQAMRLGSTAAGARRVGTRLLPLLAWLRAAAAVALMRAAAAIQPNPMEAGVQAVPTDEPSEPSGQSPASPPPLAPSGSAPPPADVFTAELNSMRRHADEEECELEVLEGSRTPTWLREAADRLSDVGAGVDAGGEGGGEGRRKEGGAHGACAPEPSTPEPPQGRVDEGEGKDVDEGEAEEEEEEEEEEAEEEGPG